MKVEALKKFCVEYQENPCVNIEASQQDRPIQGLYYVDLEGCKFYSLLARVLLGKSSEKRRAEGERE